MRTFEFSGCVIVFGLIVFLRDARPSELDFNRDIRPILSDQCFSCHGPDSATRQADLRLDLRQAAVDSGVIALDHPENSSILQRIVSNDPDAVMPPPESGKHLSAEQLGTLRRWIESGAKYDEHWAFVFPQRPDIPHAVIDSAIVEDYRVNNSIDHFVVAQLAGTNLRPSPPADRATLVRRLFLDLIGLPPQPDELEHWTSYLGDRWSEALVDRLLESKHFGERWARWWLDAARYSDSDGYEKDKQREVWFYRDWVIRAMNDDMPYDQFIIRQIAGDLRPSASQDDRVATGFLRNSMVNEEGGADPEQFRVEGLFDRMDAIGKSILGITTQCAQCHSHKFDPLTQEEYYAMFAALNNCHEAMIAVYSPDDLNLCNEVRTEIEKIENELRDQHPMWQEELSRWHQQLSSEMPIWKTLKPTELPWEGQKFKLLEDGSILSESYAPTKSDNFYPCQLEPGTYTAVRLDLLTHWQLPLGGPGRSVLGSGALTEFEFNTASADDPNKKVPLKIKRAVADVNPPTIPLPMIYREQDPSKDDRVTGPIEMAIDGDAKTAWSCDNGPGRRNQDRHAIFEFETPLVVSQPTTVWVRLKQNHGGWNSDDNQNYLFGRYRFSITESSNPTGHVVPASVQPLLALEFSSLTLDEIQKLFSAWRTTQEAMVEANNRIEAHWQRFPAGASQLVVVQRDEPRETYVMLRGDFLKPGVRVVPGTPAFLHVQKASSDPPRLKFARWLADGQSPTTARVVVNRIWQAYFGRAIVATPEDFGHQSPAPTHPDMLDWLAVELMDSGWSLKHIHRLIANSATYQQSSVANAEQVTSDRYNELLARGPRFRMEAEMVRDLGLSVSGLLDRHIGGPSVYPPAPQFLFEPPASYGPKVWHQEQASGHYRRSLYVHSYRSMPYPPLQVFDSPKGDGACVRRERSNNPLQALVLLNEPQFVEFARATAGRVLREAPSDRDDVRIAYAHALITGRTPEQGEVDVLLQLLNRQRQRIDDGTLVADPLVGASEQLARQLTGRSAKELLPWIVVARAILNLDETITKG